MFANRVAHPLSHPGRAGRSTRLAGASDIRRTERFESAMRQAEFYAFVGIGMVFLTTVSIFVAVASLVE